jgi:cbb3-type cytochrome oxidase subunit 3
VEMTSLIDTLIGLFVAGLAWFLSEQNKETKRIGILLNKTREEYATRMELRDDMSKVMDALHRVEDKLDKVLSREL